MVLSRLFKRRKADPLWDHFINSSPADPKNDLTPSLRDAPDGMVFPSKTNNSDPAETAAQVQLNAVRIKFDSGKSPLELTVKDTSWNEMKVYIPQNIPWTAVYTKEKIELDPAELGVIEIEYSVRKGEEVQRYTMQRRIHYERNTNTQFEIMSE